MNFPDEAYIGPVIGFYHEEARWWDQWLKGEDTDIMEEPMLQVYMQELTPGQVYPKDVPGRWVAEHEWPSKRIVDGVFFLNEDGIAQVPGPEVQLVQAPDFSIGLDNKAWLPFAMDTELPRNQANDDAKSLTFDSQPLERAWKSVAIRL